jgi:hypothetical protein
LHHVVGHPLMGDQHVDDGRMAPTRITVRR